MLEKRVLEMLERRKVDVQRIGYQCGVGTVLEQWQYDGAMRNRNFVISWFLLGEGSYRENGENYTLTDACVCMRRPGHAYTMELQTRDSIRLYLTIPQDTYPAIVRIIPELEGLPPVWNCPFDRDLAEEFCALYDHLTEISSMELHTALPKMIQYILRLTGIQKNRESDPLALAKRMLEENWLLPLEEIAVRCGMKYNTFRKRFTEAYSTSPGQYRIRRRVEEGCRLLTRGMSVGKTAVLLGYADVYSFTHQFTAVMGMPPGRYQEEKTRKFL